MNIKVFAYIQDLDAFVLTEDYKKIASYLGIIGWEQFAWIGRFFSLDNDYGEHWMDNWELRARLPSHQFDESEVLIVDPDRFKNDVDGPCHDEKMRKLFWTDVLKSFHISLESLIEEARKNKNDWERNGIEDAEPGEYIKDLEQRISEVLHSKNTSS